MAENADPIHDLYVATSPHYNLGSEDAFRKNMADPTAADAYYKAVSPSFNLGSPDAFYANIGLKKKDNTNGISNSLDSNGQSQGELPDAEKQRIANSQVPYQNPNDITLQDQGRLQPIQQFGGIVKQPISPNPLRQSDNPLDQYKTGYKPDLNLLQQQREATLGQGQSDQISNPIPDQTDATDTGIPQPKQAPIQVETTGEQQQQAESQNNALAGTGGQVTSPQTQADESTFDPITKSVLGLSAGAEQLHKGLDQLLMPSGEDFEHPLQSLGEGTTNTLVGGVKGVFSGASLINPELAGINAGFDIANQEVNALGGEKAAQWIQSPFSKWAESVGIDNKIVKNLAELGDTGVQIGMFALAHGVIGLGKAKFNDYQIKPIIRELNLQKEPYETILASEDASPELKADAQQKVDAVNQSIEQVKTDPKYAQSLREQAVQKLSTNQPTSPIEDAALKPVVEEITPESIEQDKKELITPEIQALQDKHTAVGEELSKMKVLLDNPDVPDAIKEALQPKYDENVKGYSDLEAQIAQEKANQIANVQKVNDIDSQIESIGEKKAELEKGMGTVPDEYKPLIQKQIKEHDKSIAELEKQKADIQKPIEDQKEDFFNKIPGIDKTSTTENKPLNTENDVTTENKPNGESGAVLPTEVPKQEEGVALGVDANKPLGSGEEPKLEHPDVQKQRINDLLGSLREYNGLSEAKKRASNGKQLNLSNTRRANDLGFTIKDGKLLDEKGKTVGTKRLSKTDSTDGYQKLSDFDKSFQDHVNKLLPYIKEYNIYEPNIDVPMDAKSKAKGIKDIQEGKKSKEAQGIFDALKNDYERGEIPIKAGTGGNLTKWTIPIKEFDERIDSVRPEKEGLHSIEHDEEQILKDLELKHQDYANYEKSIAENESSRSNIGTEEGHGKDVRQENEPKTGTGEGGAGEGVEGKSKDVKMSDQIPPAHKDFEAVESKPYTKIEHNKYRPDQQLKFNQGNYYEPVTIIGDPKLIELIRAGKTLKDGERSNISFERKKKLEKEVGISAYEANNRAKEIAKQERDKNIEKIVVLGNKAEFEANKEQPLNIKKDEKSDGKQQEGQNAGQENDHEQNDKTRNGGEAGKENAEKFSEQPLQKEQPSGSVEKTALEKKREALSKALRDARGQANINPVVDWAKISDAMLDYGAELIKSGVNKFADWSKQMLEDFGDNVRPHLDRAWDNLNGEKVEGSSAIKNRITKGEEKAGEMNLTNPHFKTMEEHRIEGKRIYEDGEVPDMIKSFIKGDKQYLTTPEVEAMRIYKEKQIDNKVEQTTEALVNAQKSLNVKEIEKSFDNSEKTKKKREEFYQALKIAKPLAGQTLRMFQGLRESEYSMSDVLDRATIANKGLELTSEQQKFYQEAVENVRKREKDLEDYQEAKKKTAGEQEAQKQIDREKGIAKRTTAPKGTYERFKQERQVSKDIISKLLEKQRSEAHASLIPSLPAGVYVEIAKIAKSYVHEGVVRLSDIVDKTLHELKDSPEITKQHIIDALSGNYPKELKTKTELQANIAEIKKQAQLTVKLNNLENGIINKRSITEKGEDSQAVKDLKKRIIAEHDRLFPKDTTEAISAKRYKTYLKNKLEGLNTQINEGKFEKPQPRNPRPYDEKELKLKAEIGKAKNIIDQRIYEDEMRTKKWYKKVYPAMHNLRVFNMIMSPLTFGKVLGHSVSEFAAHPLDEAGEWGMRKIFKNLNKLSEKGSPTVNSIREYYKAIVDSDTYKDMWTQLSQYENTLELAHGEKSGVIDESYRYKPANTFEKITKSAGNLHAAEKVVLEHAAYRESFSKRVAQFIKQNNGNPLTGEQEAFAEGGAMLDALEAIMRSKNKVSDITNNLANQSGLAKTALEVLTPIRRVPLNIARQVALRNPITTLYGAGELAFRKFQTMRGKEVTPKQMDDAFKHFSKGLTGSGLFALGMMFPNIFGGFYDPDRKEEDISASGIKGLPIWLSRIISANPLMLTVQMGATLRRNLDSGFYGEGRSLKSIAGNTAMGITEEIPYLSQIEGINKAFGSTKEGARFAERFVNSYYTPGAIPQFTGLADTNDEFEKDKDGHLVKRIVGKKDEPIKNEDGEVKSWGERFDDTKSDFAKDWSDSWKSHYPGLRQTLPKKGEE